MEINRITYYREQLAACSVATESLGLFNGQVGLALCYNSLYALSRSETDKERVHFLLDEVCSNIGRVQTISFSDGLLGIGWGMTNIQSDMDVNENVKELLANIDDFIYKNVTLWQSSDFSLESGVIGKAFYLYQHLLSDTQVGYYRNIAHKECLILLVTELLRYLTGVMQNEREPVLHEKRNVAHAFILLYYLNHLKLNTVVMDDWLYELKMYLTKYLWQKSGWDIEDEYLMYCYGFIAKLSKDKEMLVQHAKWTDQSVKTNPVFFSSQDKDEVKGLLRVLLTESGKAIWYIT